jgi:hypothetical protein
VDPEIAKTDVFGTGLLSAGGGDHQDSGVVLADLEGEIKKIKVKIQLVENRRIQIACIIVARGALSSASQVLRVTGF